MTYEVWTYDQVRAQIIEAAETLLMGPAALGPRLVGMGLFEEYQDDYRRGEATPVRRVPSGRALAAMEETWVWINTWLCEADRKLVYDYGFIMARKGLTIAGWCERNGWIRRTFERAVNRCCQQIANELNRKHEVRLTVAFDGMSQDEPYSHASEVASDTNVQAQRVPFSRSPGSVPTHDPSPEAAAEIARHIEMVNKHRREDAERQRKAILREREDAARLAAQVAARQQAKRRAA